MAGNDNLASIFKEEIKKIDDNITNFRKYVGREMVETKETLSSITQRLRDRLQIFDQIRSNKFGHIRPSGSNFFKVCF